MTVEQKKKMKEEELKYKEMEKIDSSNILIQPEGKFIQILPGGGQVQKETGIKIRKFKSFNLIPFFHDAFFFLIVSTTYNFSSRKSS